MYARGHRRAPARGHRRGPLGSFTGRRRHRRRHRHRFRSRSSRPLYERHRGQRHSARLLRPHQGGPVHRFLRPCPTEGHARYVRQGHHRTDAGGGTMGTEGPHQPGGVQGRYHARHHARSVGVAPPLRHVALEDPYPAGHPPGPRGLRSAGRNEPLLYRARPTGDVQCSRHPQRHPCHGRYPHQER